MPTSLHLQSFDLDAFSGRSHMNKFFISFKSLWFAFNDGDPYGFILSDAGNVWKFLML